MFLTSLDTDVSTCSVTGTTALRLTQCWVCSLFQGNKQSLFWVACTAPRPLSGSASSPLASPLQVCAPSSTLHFHAVGGEAFYSGIVHAQAQFSAGMEAYQVLQLSQWMPLKSFFILCSPAFWVAFVLVFIIVSFCLFWVFLILLFPVSFSVLGEFFLFLTSNLFVYFKLTRLYILTMLWNVFPLSWGAEVVDLRLPPTFSFFFFWYRILLW